MSLGDNSGMAWIMDRVTLVTVYNQTSCDPSDSDFGAHHPSGKTADYGARTEWSPPNHGVLNDLYRHRTLMKAGLLHGGASYERSVRE